MRRTLMMLSMVAGSIAVVQTADVVPVAAATGAYQAINPARVTDTRPGFEIDDTVSDPKGVRTPGTTLKVPVVGRGGVPNGATAVTLNLTATGTKSAGFLRVYPCGTTPPTTSSLNLQPGVDVANSVFTKLGADGDICIFTQGTSHVIVDITGYVPTGASPRPLNPTRVTDTRKGFKIDDKVSDPKGIRTPGTTLTVPITGRGGVPKGASAVLLNLTATGTSSPGFLRVYPCGTTPPTTSSLNLQPGVDVANSVFSKLGDDGAVCVFAQGNTHIIVDITGYVPTNASPAALNPARLADTRPGYEIDDDGFDPKGVRQSQSTLTIPVAGRGGVPKNASAVTLNLTATGTETPGYLRVYPCGSTPPTTSSLNLQPKVDVANSVFSKLGKDGAICIFALGTTHVIVDITGYVVPPKVVPVQTKCKINGTQVLTQISQSECDALIDLYKATGGPKWSSQNGWNTATDPCTWGGVRCRDGHVTDLSRSGRNLTGSLPASIASLTQLQSLTLYDNGLTGIPGEIGRLANLRSLLLNRNQLTQLPPQIGNLRKLDTLWLSGNQLGSLPAEISKLTALTQLSADGIGLTSFPDQILTLTKLDNLDLSRNRLSSIPDDFSKLTALRQLLLSEANLSAVPAGVLGLKNLEVLSLGSNNITSIPAEIGQMTGLLDLSIGRNQITAVPSSLGELTQLTQLDLYWNNLSSIPTPISKLVNLTYLNLGLNANLRGDVTTVFAPLVKTNKMTTLRIWGTGCLTASSEVGAWLEKFDSRWNNGC